MLLKICVSFGYIRRFSAISLHYVDCSTIRYRSSNTYLTNRRDETRIIYDVSSSICATSSSNCSGENRSICGTCLNNCSGETQVNCDVSSSFCGGETRVNCNVSSSICATSSSNCSSETRINCDFPSSVCNGEAQDPSLFCNNVDIRIKPRLEEPALIKLKNERDPDRLFRLFKENARNRLVVENKYAFEDTISRLAGAGRYDYIEHLLEHQKSLPQGKREGFVVRIIMLYGRAGMVKKAVDTFYNMHLFRCKRTVKSFNATLKVLAQARDLEAISLFLKEVPYEFGVELDVVSMNIAVSAFCQIGKLDKAYLVMVEMEKQGILSNGVTFTTLISAFYKCGRWEIGNGLWNLMVYKGCRPNVATFNARIQFLGSRGRAWQANQLLCFMEELGMLPDEVSYNLVIKGFFEAGFLDMARRVYSALHSRGRKSNLKIYQTMVHYLCKAGDFDSAYNLCKDCLKKNWIINVGTICTLLKGLKSKGKVHNAWMIIGLAERRRPPFPGQQLDSFKSILGRP